MLQFSVKWGSQLCKTIKRCPQDLAEIAVCQPAAIHSHDIVEATPLMHAKCQRDRLLLHLQRRTPSYYGSHNDWDFP